MIEVFDKTFKLDTEHTSYIFTVTGHGHLEHIYYGQKIPDQDFSALRLKNNITLGSCVDYRQDTPGYCLDSMLLEYSGIGKGDYRHTPLECRMGDGTFVTDFVFDSFEIQQGAYSADSALPFAHGEGQTLMVKLCDRKFPEVCLLLSYCVFDECDVIVRNTQLLNGGNDPIELRRIMSAMLDLPTGEYELLTLQGGWAKEAHAQTQSLCNNIIINDSTVGASSNRHNPAFLLKEQGSGHSWGNVYGVNLIYSGNHYSAVERSNHNTLRIMTGISPHCFSFVIKPGESFITPQAVLSFSPNGTNALALQMHRFVNSHIIPEEFSYKTRPVVLNNWEATFFDFDKAHILKLARQAKELGVELFVLDDGWFGKRNNDRASLGDWTVNEKKLPGGIRDLCKQINQMGMDFGLWFEPECVNEDSDLYRNHPDWAITIPGRAPSKGRNQMVLDLTRREVRDYIVDAVDKVLCSANIRYVKWDYNRHISDMYGRSLSDQGEFFHRYILGLYEVLRRIFREKHPQILLESCSSGGNRFDLGMLCFSPQVWTSDDTDAAERMDIQGGMYYFYPQSAISNHVSMTPNQQTLRDIALSTRFNVAVFGVLGYELDFGELTPEQRKQIKAQIAFYKAHKHTFQYGALARYSPRPGSRESWQVKGDQEMMAAIFNTSYHASDPRDHLKILQAENVYYDIESVEQKLRIGRFGGLVKHISPVHIKADGMLMRTVDRHFSMKDGTEHYRCSGQMLRSGINLVMQYSGTGYNDSIRVLGDWGSTLYHLRPVTGKEK